MLAQGRLSLSRSQPRRAIECYQKAMSVQSQYRNLHHLSFWEMAISNLGLWEIEEALKCWRNLHKESTVNEHFKYKCAELTGLLFFFSSSRCTIVVKGGLRVWRRGASDPAGRRREQSRGPEAHDGGPETASAHRGQVDTARKVRRAQITEMRGAGRPARAPRTRARVHPPRGRARAALGDRGADASACGGCAC